MSEMIFAFITVFLVLIFIIYSNLIIIGFPSIMLAAFTFQKKSKMRIYLYTFIWYLLFVLLLILFPNINHANKPVIDTVGWYPICSKFYKILILGPYTSINVKILVEGSYDGYYLTKNRLLYIFVLMPVIWCWIGNSVYDITHKYISKLRKSKL
ncbi:MAG: hypothetical protein KAI43_12785 [Candidatus Aureabacteria bacterium]|nr:hypothetical protein [Candidatus Auribacterota bacterium]